MHIPYLITHPSLTVFLILTIQMLSNASSLNIASSPITLSSLSIYDTAFLLGTCPPFRRPLFCPTIHLPCSIPMPSWTIYTRRSYPAGCQGLSPRRRPNSYCMAHSNHPRSLCLPKPNSAEFLTKSGSASIYRKQQRFIPPSTLTSTRKTSPHDSIWLQKLQTW